MDATSFLPKVDFATGSCPNSIAIGDLDGDGKADLVVANVSSSTLSVFRNTGTPGTASYAAKIDLVTGANPLSVAIGDLDGDGKADLVVVSYGYGVSVFHNTGTPGVISYAAKVDLSAVLDPRSVAIGDLDSDGKADLAVTSSNGVSIFRNTGTPGAISYAARIDFATGSSPFSVAIGDLDGDGKADLAVTIRYGVSILRNTGTPGSISYAAKSDFNTSSGISTSPSIVIGDLDGDGRADLAMANYYYSLVSVLHNSGAPGTINFTGFGGGVGTGPNPKSVAIGDLDGDGKADLAVVSDGSNTVSVFRNTGTPGTISYTTKTDFATGVNPRSLAIGDLDGDGKADLVVANCGSNTLSVLRHEPKLNQIITFNSLTSKIVGDAPFTLSAISTSGLPISYTSTDPTVATVNGNIVTILRAGITSIIASQNGNAMYFPAYSVLRQLIVVDPLAQIASFTPTSGPVGTAVTISGTGFSSTPANNIVYFGATRAAVTAASATQLTVTVPIGATYQPITVLVNGIIAYSKFPFSTTYPGWGKVDATSFLPKVDFATGTNPGSVAIGDLDGDGRADLAVANYSINTISVFRNTGTPGTVSYAAKIDFATGANPYSVAIGDLDGDGKADLAVANYVQNTLSVFRNTGTPGRISYAPKIDFATGTNPYSVAIGDLDGDGRADLAVSNWNNTLSVLRNTGVPGTISYAPKIDFATGAAAISIAIGDLDGDSKADLAAINGNNVSVFRNTSTTGIISYAAKIDFATGAYIATSFAIGDLDGDGKADLAVTNLWSNTLSVFRNTGTPGTISYAAKLDFVTSSSPRSVSIGDLDGDRKADLAVANWSSNTVSVFRNTGTPGAVSYAAKVDFVTGSNPRSVAIGDLDGDGKADVAVANQSSNTLSILRHESLSSQTITFNPLSSACINTTVNLSATASSGLAITYTSSNPAIASVAGNVVTTLAAGTVTITASQAGNGTYIPATATQSLIVNPLPTATISASGATTFCSGGSVTLTASTGSSYLWSTGATTQSITVGIAGNYTVRVTNANGCMSAASVPTTVTVNPPPVASLTAAASNIYGPVTLCSGSSVSMSTPFNPNYSYRWRNYRTYISGATSASYTTSYGGWYVVEVTDNVTLCSSQSNTLTVNINQEPEVYIIGDGATFCSGSSTSLTAVSSAPYFAWSTGVAGSYASTINVFSGGTYSVTVYQNGCQSTAQATVYEQYCDPNPDPCVMYGYCPCYDQFCPRKETPDGSEPSDDPNVSELSVFPNPAIGQVTVALPARVEVDTPVRFFDLLGRQQGNVNIPKGQWKVSVSLDQAAEGTYIVKVGRSGAYRKLVVKK